MNFCFESKTVIHKDLPNTKNSLFARLHFLKQMIVFSLQNNPIIANQTKLGILLGKSQGSWTCYSWANITTGEELVNSGSIPIAYQNLTRPVSI